MNQHFEVTAVSADQKELERVAAKFGVKYHHIEMTREISPLKDLRAVWKFYQFLRQEKPEIVHSHTPKAGIVGMLASYFAGVPNRFHTVAGLPLMEATGVKRIVLNMVERLTCQFATKVYPNSFELEKFIIKEKFCSPQKLKVLGKGSSNGIDISYFSKDQITEEDQINIKIKLGIKPNDFVFVFVGRLVKDKGINELVAAFKNLQLSNQLTDKIKSTKLLLVGPLETALDPLSKVTLKEIQHNPQIISVGFQNDVRPYLAISQALVFPSYREGFPNVVLQAGAMELPSVVCDINGCNEIIKHDFNGLIIPVKNEKALEEAMLLLLTNQLLYKNLRQNSRKNITDNYEQLVVWEAILAEYRSI